MRLAERYRLPPQIHALPGVADDLAYIFVRPGVIVNAVIDLHQTIRLAIAVLAGECVSYDVFYPVLEVGAPIELRGNLIFGDEMLQRGSLSPRIEGVSLIWDLQQQNAPGSEYPVPVPQRRQGKWHVLENVAGDDEIKTAIQKRQSLGIRDDIWKDEVLRYLRVLPTQDIGVNTVHEPHGDSRPHRESSSTGPQSPRLVRVDGATTVCSRSSGVERPSPSEHYSLWNPVFARGRPRLERDGFEFAASRQVHARLRTEVCDARHRVVRTAGHS